jgi:hypothetical protein
MRTGSPCDPVFFASMDGCTSREAWMPGAMPSRYHVVRSKTAGSNTLKAMHVLSRTALPKLHANEVTVRHMQKTGNLPDQVLFMRTRMAIGKSNCP